MDIECKGTWQTWQGLETWQQWETCKRFSVQRKFLPRSCSLTVTSDGQRLVVATKLVGGTILDQCSHFSQSHLSAVLATTQKQPMHICVVKPAEVHNSYPMTFARHLLLSHRLCNKRNNLKLWTSQCGGMGNDAIKWPQPWL